MSQERRSRADGLRASRAKRGVSRAFGAGAALLLLATCARQPATCTASEPDPNVMCTQQYEPVCGCDGKSYSNRCVARIHGITQTRPGLCEENDEQI